jgi:hypothetical protein
VSLEGVLCAGFRASAVYIFLPALSVRARGTNITHEKLNSKSSHFDTIVALPQLASRRALLSTQFPGARGLE